MSSRLSIFDLPSHHWQRASELNEVRRSLVDVYRDILRGDPLFRGCRTNIRLMWKRTMADIRALANESPAQGDPDIVVTVGPIVPREQP